MTLSINMLCHYAECHDGGRHILFFIKLNVIMPSVINAECHNAECQ
jgi:hypothetical protein